MTNNNDIFKAAKASQAEILQRIGWIGLDLREVWMDSREHRQTLHQHSQVQATKRKLLCRAVIRAPSPQEGSINVKNNDIECFRWCHLAHKFPVKKDVQRPAKYKDHIGKLDYSGIKFPVELGQSGKI